MSEDTPDRMSEDMPDRMSEDISIKIEWASALVPPTPLCGGRRAGLVNKTTGEAKTVINRAKGACLEGCLERLAEGLEGLEGLDGLKGLRGLRAGKGQP